MVDQVRFVNRAIGNTSGGDGTTNNITGADRAFYVLDEWRVSRSAAYVTGDREIVNCSGDPSNPDTTFLNLFGFTGTDIVNRVIINGGYFNGYRLDSTALRTVNIFDPYVTVNNLRVNNASAINGTPARGIHIRASASLLTDIILDGCVVTTDKSLAVTPSGGAGIDVDPDINVIVKACVIEGRYLTGIIRSGSTTAINSVTYNNTVRDVVNVGIQDTGLNATPIKVLKNNIVETPGADYSVSGTFLATSNNISSDATSPQVALQNLTALYLADGFHLDAADTVAKGQGTILNPDPDGLSDVILDIDEEAYSLTAPSIGADEVITAIGVTPLGDKTGLGHVIQLKNFVAQTEVFPPIVSAGGNVSGDTNTPIQINGTVTGGTNTTILWTNSGTGSYNDATIQNPIWTGTVAESITHTITASSDNWIDIEDTVIVTTGAVSSSTNYYKLLMAG